MNGHGRLPVLEGRKVLRHGNRNRRIARNNLLDQAAHSFQPERKRRHVQQQPIVVGTIAREQISLARRADRHHFIGINVVKRIKAEVVFNGFAHHGHASGAAHKHKPLDFRLRQPGIFHHRAQRINGFLHQIGGDVF